MKDIDLTRALVIVAGGYVSRGLHTTKAMLSAAAAVIVPVCPLEKAATNFSRLNVETSRLINMNGNTRVMVSPLFHDSREYETQFSTHHLEHFRLTARL